jgi:quercetin dioxygenase-like cupin family protein
MNDIRIRIVEYSAGYLADHWCNKGHIIYCIEGEMETELQDGRKFILSKGMSYQLGDNEAHCTYTQGGCRLFIVD